MEGAALISALSLFAGFSLLPAVFLILREKEIPLDAHQRVTGGAAIVVAVMLLALAILFLLNAFAQDLALLLACAFGLAALPMLVIVADRRRKTRKV